MVWSPSEVSNQWTSDAPIQPSDVLYAYDGPTIFTAFFGFFEAIFLKIEEFAETDLFLVTNTSDQIIDALKRGKLSVRGGFAGDRLWIAETTKTLAVRRYWSVARDDLPHDFLPNKNLTLFAHLGRAPDTLLQSTSFFSVAFQGEKMKRDGMPFSQFKGLVGAVHDAARRVLTPVYLNRTRTATFDYSLQAPAFSSLILAIKRPIINEIAAMRRIPSDFSNSIHEHFAEQRDIFLEEMREVVQEAENGDVSDNIVQERYFLLEAVQNIIPSEENNISSVDFVGAGEMNVSSVGLNAKTGDKIHRAFKRAHGISREIHGKIEITNAPSSYFVLETAGRQINCAVERSIYKRLEKNPEFRNGALVWVKGDLYRRPRRDWLRVEGEPRIAAGTEN